MRGHDGADDYLPEPGATHETRDISTRVVVTFAASLVVGAIFIQFLIWVLYGFYGSLQDKAFPRQYPLAQTGAPPQPPAPRLQTQPREDLKNMRAEEERRLNGYGWVDASRGEAHIPITRAMELLLQQGLPARQEAPPGTSPGLPEKSSSGRTSVGNGR
jgi:hypothetical protein